MLQVLGQKYVAKAIYRTLVDLYLYCFIKAIVEAYRYLLNP